MNTKFSIIVPIYKVRDYLEECIESIINQTYSNLEIILVDDGSPDECPAICDRYAAQDSRIVVIHKENGGLVRARQAGAERASGEYICCVDGDDYIASDYIEKMAIAVQRGADIVCCGYILTSEEGETAYPIRYQSGMYDRKRIEHEIFPHLMQNASAGYFPPSPCMKAIRRTLFCEAQRKVDPVITVGEDRAVAVPCFFRCQSMAILDDCLYYYRVNPQSMTRNRKSFRWEGLEALAEHMRREIDLSQLDFQAQYDRFVAHEFFNTAKSQFNRKEPYRKIRAEILEKMSQPVFAEAIGNCHFNRSVKATLMELCLKKRWMLPIWAANKFL